MLLKSSKTRFLAGTSLLSALAFVIDYSLAIFRLKIVFPLQPTLKFDLSGLPIGIGTSLFGIGSAFFCSFALFISISMRGAPLSAFMKSLAEFSTALGMSLMINRRRGSWLSIPSGVTFRTCVMFVANSFLYPEQTNILIGIFNIIAGTLTSTSGYLSYLALRKRLMLE